MIGFRCVLGLTTLSSVLLLPAISRAQPTIQVIAGNGGIFESGIGGAAISAGIGYPTGLAADSAGNVYIADQLGNKVLKITKTTGVVTVFAGSGTPFYSGDGGLATSAGMGFSSAHTGLAFDSKGNLYITDSTDNRIRMVNPSGIISTFAGSGTLGGAGFSGDGGAATAAKLNTPEGVAVDSAGNVYIADTGNDEFGW
jgi:sugar lactone lactonase YvrE